MTSRPGPGLHESLQSRGSALPPRAQVRRQLSKPANVLVHPECIDPTLEDERPPAHAAVHDALRAPPRGQPQYLYSTLASNGLELPIHSLPYQPTANLPVPPRPGSLQFTDAVQLPRIVPGGTGVKDDPKVSAPEAVAPPVQLPGGRAADLFPWTGNNAEDVLSEALVKGGISNKPQIMNETNTARPSLWSNLKNKSGLSTLSTLFVAVLEKRQQSGRLQAPNNFKPPPRLTLRDSTREQWLHDLANPATGLRRLSRTIPHGLTGKVLLEQCLNKNIPLPRALWLAKCVGINELRAHKRKGQAGTVTWSRGWTSCVEQFLDGVIGTIGQGNWKPRITYALQLSTYLYKEHLLDDDHFLDWVLHGLETCPSERLFVWLLIVSVAQYWTDMTSCRRRGKRLAQSLLGQLEKVYQFEDMTPYTAVLQYLESTLIKLIATQPACLLLPKAWNRYGLLLHRLARRRNLPQIHQAVERLDDRNRRLMWVPLKNDMASQSAVERVYRLLDNVDYDCAVRIEELSLACMETMADSLQLIAILLQWACSRYRYGTHRLYLTIRLLRRWHHLGADVYEGVVAFLRQMNWVETTDCNILFKIVGELVRSKTFPTGRYLQWLIATGSLAEDTNISLPAAWPIRLITEIPLTGLSDQIRTLRRSLLHGTQHSAELEDQALESAERVIVQTLPALFGLCDTSKGSDNPNLENLSTTVKLELGIWLRRHVANYAEVNERVPTKDPAIEETAAVSLINAADFAVVRSHLEAFGDLAILADVVGIVTSSLDPTVLAAAADTINYHFEVFRAMGACDPLYSRVAARYAALRSIRLPERELVLSLSNLTRSIQAEGQICQLLGYDLSRLEHKQSIAACSPASDNMGEAMHSTSSSGDEIERILSSGNSMDQQIMGRVLRKILSNVQECVLKNSSTLESYPGWLHRLRSFDDSTFDSVASEWLRSALADHHNNSLEITIPLLVGSGCMSLTNVLESLRTLVKAANAQPSHEAFTRAIFCLQHLIIGDGLVDTCPVQEAYRFRLEQQKLCRHYSECIVDRVADVLVLGSSLPRDEVQPQLSKLLASGPVLSMIKYCLVNSHAGLPRSLQNTGERYIGSLLCMLLDPNDRLRLLDMLPEEQVFVVFEMTTELSLPVCQAMIGHIFTTRSAASDEVRGRLSAALLSATKNAVEKEQSAGLMLLASLDSSLTNQIRQHAESEIIQAASFLLLPGDGVHNSAGSSLLMVQKFLTIIELTHGDDSPTTDHSTLLLSVLDRLRAIVQALGSDSASQDPIVDAMTLPVQELFAWSNALLRLAISRCPQLLLNAPFQHQAGLITILKSLITHPVLERHPSLIQHVFDAAVHLSDCISDDVRNHFVRLDSMGFMDNARCLFVFGTAAPVDGWLVLVKPLVGSSNQHSSQPPTPTTSQNYQSSLQSSQTPSGEASNPQQRIFAQQGFQRQQQQTNPQPAQQSRLYNQHASQPQKIIPAQLQRTPSLQSAMSPLQQMQQMQQMQGLAQQRVMQPSPVHSHRQTSAMGHGAASGMGIGAGKSQVKQDHEIRQYAFAHPRWEILAESSGNPNANETAISMSLFGARRV